VEVFDTTTGNVFQIYLPFQDSSGSFSGITYSADGKYLMFSQDSSPTAPNSSYIALANVSSEGLLTDYAHVAVPPNNSFIKCFPNSRPGESACGTFYTPNTAYPGGVAFAKDGKTAYALLNQNNTLTKVDLTRSPLTQGPLIRVGNAPHSIVLDGKTAYISDEGGRVATEKDFQISPPPARPSSPTRRALRSLARSRWST
jgi:DNA-binding beta-propeller fold protein YncE